MMTPPLVAESHYHQQDDVDDKDKNKNNKNNNQDDKAATTAALSDSVRSFTSSLFTTSSSSSSLVSLASNSAASAAATTTTTTTTSTVTTTTTASNRNNNPSSNQEESSGNDAVTAQHDEEDIQRASTDSHCHVSTATFSLSQPTQVPSSSFTLLSSSSSSSSCWSEPQQQQQQQQQQVGPLSVESGLPQQQHRVRPHRRRHRHRHRQWRGERTVAFLQCELEQRCRSSPFLRQAVAMSMNMIYNNSSNNNRNDKNKDKDDDDSSNNKKCIGLFARSELITGRLLGEGEYSVVYEVIDIRLDETVSARMTPFQQQCRLYYAKHCTLPTTTTTATLSNSSSDSASSSSPAQPQGRYAIKFLKRQPLESNNNNNENTSSSTTTTTWEDFRWAALDLVVESCYLWGLDHPHIAPLRGFPVDHYRAYLTGNNFFCLMDRLECTLQDRIQQWNTNNNITNCTTNNSPSIAVKATYAYQLASALQYLHERRIVFRDCKPTNIGFALGEAGTQTTTPNNNNNNNITVQLFDLGLCRELPPLSPPRERLIPRQQEQQAEEDDEAETDRSVPTVIDKLADVDYDINNNSSNDDDGCCEEVYYEMSDVGTRRYMAPEVVNSKEGYNTKVDVYSWAIVVWQLLYQSIPYQEKSVEEHLTQVCQQGERPPFPPLPNSTTDSTTTSDNTLLLSFLHGLLQQAWEQCVPRRLTMQQVCQRLQWILEQQQQQQQHYNQSCPRPPKTKKTTVSAQATTTTKSTLSSSSSLHHQYNQFTKLSPVGRTLSWPLNCQRE